MTALWVAFVVWTCPGTVRLLGIPIPLASLPDAAKPRLGALGICQGRPALEAWDPAREAEARQRVLALGEPAQMYLCRGAKCGPPMVEWGVEAKFKEARP